MYRSILLAKSSIAVSKNVHNIFYQMGDEFCHSWLI